MTKAKDSVPSNPGIRIGGERDAEALSPDRALGMEGGGQDSNQKLLCVITLDDSLDLLSGEFGDRVVFHGEAPNTLPFSGGRRRRPSAATAC